MTDHENRAELQKLIAAVEMLRLVDPKMELGQALVLLLILKEPGVKVPKLLDATGLSRSALSRNINALSQTSYLAEKESGKKSAGHHLIDTRPDPSDNRATIASATARGRELAQQLSKVLQNGRLS
ncbi:MAG TPA: hypothetical protein VGN97_16965 [Mesorhizobium sp.]|jgi:DNA-binding MarR family transcriptional regulator|nr:hypothetical protein [Mesorhizobium sp.]